MDPRIALTLADWVTIAVGGTALWGLAWIGRELADKSPRFKSAATTLQDRRQYGMQLFRLAVSLILAGALLAIHELRQPTNITEAFAIGILAASPAVLGMTSDRTRSIAHAIARGVWIPLGIVVLSVVLFLVGTWK